MAQLESTRRINPIAATRGFFTTKAPMMIVRKKPSPTVVRVSQTVSVIGECKPLSS
jgi:hypothetical protein